MSIAVPVHDGLFTTGDNPRLLGSRCMECGGHHFPRHDLCAYCSSERVEPVELSTMGSLWAWTAVTASPPGYLGAVPFGFGVVELPEGVRIVTRLTVGDPAQFSLGQSVRLVVVPLHTNDEGNDVVTYAFGPA